MYIGDRPFAEAYSIIALRSSWLTGGARRKLKNHLKYRRRRGITGSGGGGAASARSRPFAEACMAAMSRYIENSAFT